MPADPHTWHYDDTSEARSIGVPDADLAGGQGCLNGCSMTSAMCLWIMLVPLHHLCWYYGTACPIGPRAPSLWFKRSQIFPDLDLCIDAIEIGAELSRTVMQRGSRHIATSSARVVTLLYGRQSPGEAYLIPTWLVRDL